VNPFLAGLVERATLRAPALERRPRSLFEPVVAKGGVAIERLGQATPDDPDDRRDPVERDDPPSTGRGELAADGDPVARAPRLASSAEAAQPHRGMPAAPAFSAARPAGNEPRLASVAEAPRGELEPGAWLEAPRDELEPVTRLDRLPAAAAWRQPPPLERQLPPMPPRGAAPPDLARRVDAVTRRPSHARKAPPERDDLPAIVPAPSIPGALPAGTHAPLLRPGIHIPGPPALIVQASAGRGSRLNGGEAMPPAPVHVTIGRIEVRASAPAAERPPVRRSPAGPRMSLDDYLNGRRRGSR
jgi:hypothetical protein